MRRANRSPSKASDKRYASRRGFEARALTDGCLASLSGTFPMCPRQSEIERFPDCRRNRGVSCSLRFLSVIMRMLGQSWHIPAIDERQWIERNQIPRTSPKNGVRALVGCYVAIENCSAFHLTPSGISPSSRWENADPRNGGQPDLSERQELGGILEEIHGDVYRDNCRDASRLPTTLRERLGRPVTCS